MASLFRYLISIFAHIFWQRSGRRGPVPPLRIPGRRTTHLPVPSPWQIMAASWVAERLWKNYGPTVKRRLKQSPSPLVYKIGDLLPGPEDTTPASASAPAAPTPMQPAPMQLAPATSVPTPPAPTASAPATPHAPSTRPGYATQPLPQNPADDHLPPGSVLRSLRPSG